MKWRHFLICNAAGGIIWSALFAISAYLAGNVIRKVGTIVAIVGGVAAAITLVVALVVIHRHLRRLELLAEEAYPGPLED